MVYFLLVVQCAFSYVIPLFGSAQDVILGLLRENESNCLALKCRPGRPHHPLFDIFAHAVNTFGENEAAALEKQRGAQTLGGGAAAEAAKRSSEAQGLGAVDRHAGLDFFFIVCSPVPNKASIPDLQAAVGNLLTSNVYPMLRDAAGSAVHRIAAHLSSNGGPLPKVRRPNVFLGWKCREIELTLAPAFPLPSFPRAPTRTAWCAFLGPRWRRATKARRCSCKRGGTG